MQAVSCANLVGSARHEDGPGPLPALYVNLKSWLLAE
jgi:hypothetical protein